MYFYAHMALACSKSGEGHLCWVLSFLVIPFLWGAHQNKNHQDGRGLDSPPEETLRILKVFLGSPPEETIRTFNVLNGVALAGPNSGVGGTCIGNLLVILCLGSTPEETIRTLNVLNRVALAGPSTGVGGTCIGNLLVILFLGSPPEETLGISSGLNGVVF